MVGHQCQIRVSIGSLILVSNWLPELVTKLEIELGVDGTCGDMMAHAEIWWRHVIIESSSRSRLLRDLR